MFQSFCDLASGAAKVFVADLTEEFLTQYVWPTLKAGAVYEGKYLLGTSFARLKRAAPDLLMGVER